MNITLIDFNTCKHSIFVMFVIGFVVGYCVGASGWLAWCYKVGCVGFLRLVKIV